MKSDAKSYYNKGKILSDVSRLEEAIECFNIAIQLNPNYDLAIFSKGTCLGKLGRFEEEFQCYETALLINPGNKEAKRNLLKQTNDSQSKKRKLHS